MDQQKINKTIVELGKKLHNRLYDQSQKGCPEINPDGTGWRYGSCKHVGYLSLEEVQALIAYAGLEELKPVNSHGNCKDCLHRNGVYGHPFPCTPDCDGCKNPLHQHFVPVTERDEFSSIKREDVFLIPTGNTIPAHIERLKMGMEDKNYSYYEANGFVYRLSDNKRICSLKSIEKLHLNGDKRRD